MSHNHLTTVNELQNEMYFGKEVINRVSFLREDSKFIGKAITHPSARFVFFNKTDPLIVKSWTNKLVLMTSGNDIFKGPEKVTQGLTNLASWKSAITKWVKDNEEHHHALREQEQPTILFLGLEDASVGLDVNSADIQVLDYKDGRYKGIPYFAVDLTASPTLEKDILQSIKTNENVDEEEIFFTTSRKHYLGFSNIEAALFSHGKMFLDWLDRNRFCPGCGSKVIPIHSGGKLKCTNTTIVGKTESGRDKYECPVQNVSVSNVSFPRTDAVVITAITNTERTKVLLSLNRRHRLSNMYSCTSGFMEPSETVEVATKREIWEETGVACSKIDIVMTQPWPFPGNLMIGCLAEVEFDGVNEIIDLDHDKELEDARWFDMSFVKSLVYPEKNNTETNPEGILIPMPESIAYSLIKLIVDQSSNSKL
ncbi:hypothetical protein CANTEDRAFT_115439 [Yamadazyma tenuis ATCC 10573]|uniref:NAD(+) diphosphatase n=1 Tax=Candida tenuis (strain ATCC 10573 / BCRC 21748 / CBS 615 / JCM 9827 / NBRC 10315 / NRRL Y-1498 / VKM Y-70) TaxID=590646 RepID=G3B9W3_CANTC|nr:uncharacterized protein CANTEDRAFT_115439 [Yamadazyma tenuis ATCC 10573]EGV62737.1 hypothetical protein CANTEDRAFT_115439 [Yamadazyma tenuis ATCC 10573]